MAQKLKIPPAVVAGLLASILRTIVPVVVGWLILQAVRLGITIDSAWLSGVVQGGITVVFYALVRYAETYGSNAWGWLLGLAKQPVYVDGTVVPAATDAVKVLAPPLP